MTTRAGHYRPLFEVQLSPKQRQVIALIERGKTNYEIAQELGVSLEGAKYHVSEILAKLDVDSREEAVRVWREYNSAGARLRRAFAGVAAMPVLRIALVATAVTPVVLAAVVFAILRGSDSGPGEAPAVVDNTATRTASAQPSPRTATATTTVGSSAITPTVETSPTAVGSPVASITSSPSTTPQAVNTTPLSVYFMRGEDVGAVLREVPATVAVARAAIEQLLSGPSAAEQAGQTLTSSIPAGTRLLDISISNGVATVDFSGEFESGGGTLSMRARLAQVVFTLSQFPTVDAVSFRIDGQPRTVFGGEGIILNDPATRADFEDVSPAIFLDSPAQGATVSSPVRLQGTANTFEAAFRVTVLDASGNVLGEQFAMATSGSGTRGTFDLTVPFDVLTPGAGVIRVYESSARDGSPVNIVDVPVQLGR